MKKFIIGAIIIVALGLYYMGSFFTIPLTTKVFKPKGLKEEELFRSFPQRER